MIELWHNSVQLRADHIRSWLRIGPGFQKSSEDFGGFTGKIREGQGKRFFWLSVCDKNAGIQIQGCIFHRFL